ncbi:MAG: hypothetical protein LBH59_02035 [Planctomycetaceae bacterium]|nr:hypothetical protein [Planctomycetaceae bacterium]
MSRFFKLRASGKISGVLPVIFEVCILFFVFCIFGGTPIPDVNEPYYIGKAIHFWNVDWCVGDEFLNSRDSHWLFYFLFGWLTFFLSPYWMAVFGRCLTWFLLAWSWQRLCFVVLGIRWSSVPIGLALAYYVSEFNMAGEWLIGGVEGKSFAFPFVIFGLADLVVGRWRRVWIFLGVASAFHVLVGGWSVVAVLLVHAICRRQPNYYFMIFGGLISLVGIVPCLLLDYGTVGDVVLESHRIYVYERLSHHLVPYMFTWTRVLRFVLLSILWASYCRFMSCGGECQRRFDYFIWGTLIISFIGLFLAYILRDNELISATVLRLYWFRMSDVAVPMGIAMGSMFQLRRLVGKLREQSFELPSFKEATIFVLIFVTIFMLVGHFLFGGLMFSWSRGVDISVTWCMAILLSGFLLFIVSKFCCGFLVFSFGKLRIWFIVIYVLVLFYLPFVKFMELADLRTRFSFPKSESKKTVQAYKWREVCGWISDVSNTPKSAKFFIPYDSVTFKWYANRSNITVWKEVPQDAKSIVRWSESIEELFIGGAGLGDNKEVKGIGSNKSDLLINRMFKGSFSQMLSKTSQAQMRYLQKKYGFNYILAPSNPDLSKRFGFKVVYQNSEYCVYKVDEVVE